MLKAQVILGNIVHKMKKKTQYTIISGMPLNQNLGRNLRGTLSSNNYVFWQEKHMPMLEKKKGHQSRT
jgi:hypothetical protein